MLLPLPTPLWLPDIKLVLLANTSVSAGPNALEPDAKPGDESPNGDKPKVADVEKLLARLIRCSVESSVSSSIVGSSELRYVRMSMSGSSSEGNVDLARPGRVEVEEPSPSRTDEKLGSEKERLRPFLKAAPGKIGSESRAEEVSRGGGYFDEGIPRWLDDPSKFVPASSHRNWFSRRSCAPIFSPSSSL